jgi:hypothetical protein
VGDELADGLELGVFAAHVHLPDEDVALSV